MDENSDAYLAHNRRNLSLLRLWQDSSGISLHPYLGQPAQTGMTRLAARQKFFMTTSEYN
jgi:hypothetical protein